MTGHSLDNMAGTQVKIACAVVFYRVFSPTREKILTELYSLFTHMLQLLVKSADSKLEDYV